MRKILIVSIATAVFSIAGLNHPLLAADGAELFIRLTCHTCHGQNGKGMFRTKTKARYRLRTKVFKKLQKAGIPKNIIKKLKPLNKKKFKKEKKFVKAIEKLLGPNDTQKYIDLIIEHAGRISYRKGDPVPGFEGYPKLAGNKEVYLYMQMKDILEGRRVNGNTKAMRGIKPFLDTNKVKDEDFRAIAKYLSKVK